MEERDASDRALMVVEDRTELVVEVENGQLQKQEGANSSPTRSMPSHVSANALAYISQAVLTVVDTLRPDTVYELVLPPGLRKALDAGELEFVGMRSILRDAKTKDFVANVPLKRVDRDIMSGLTNIPLMIAIHGIEMKLDALKEDVERILAGQHSDRVAHVRAGRDLFEMASAVRDPELKRQLLQQAVVQMVLGRDKVLQTLEAELDSLLVFVERPGLRSTSKKVAEGLRRRQGDLRQLTEGTAKVAHALAVLGEPEAARVAVDAFISDLERNAPKCSKLVRYIPTGTMGYPDDLWEFWGDGLKEHLANLRFEQARLVESSGQSLIVRFKSDQLLPGAEV